MKKADHYKGVWVLGEQVEGRVHPVTHELIGRGIELARVRRAALTVVLLGHQIPDADLQDLIDRGADRVLVMEALELRHFLCQPYAACLASLVNLEKPEIFIGGATSMGRTVMPYLAIKLNTGLTADCTVLEIDAKTGTLLQTRPAIGGNIMATIRTPIHRPQMATVRPRSSAPAPPKAGRKGEIIRRPAPKELLTSNVRRLDAQKPSQEQGLAEAEVVVCVGRGMRKADNVALAEKLAAVLKGTVGATRDAVDRGWLSYPHQIGLSGKTVTPSLYVGLGVSGSIQHLAGMQTAGTIVAINKDPEAQILKVADFALIGDLFEIVPVLISRLTAQEKK